LQASDAATNISSANPIIARQCIVRSIDLLRDQRSKGFDRGRTLTDPKRLCYNDW
jgi:hypothetical protein